MSEIFLFQNKNRGESFEYKIIKKRKTKYLKITIQKNQDVVVIVPNSRLYYVTKKQIEKILKERFDFIIATRKRYKNLARKYPDLFNFSEEHYRENRRKAQELIKSKVNYYCREYNFQYNRISIRNQQTRWGSCSSNGNLNFSYKLIFLTPEEQDYIIVHELCHLEEQNHSKNFWRLVKSILPEYEKSHKSIKEKA